MRKLLCLSICMIALCCNCATAQVGVMLKNINPNGGSDPEHFISLGNKTVFVADDGLHRGLWITDGTEAGTDLLKSIDDNGNVGNFQFHNAIEYNGKIYFQAEFIADGVGLELYVTDGTPSGTMLFMDIHPGAGGSQPFGFHKINNQFIFSANDGTASNLWTCDGTVTGTQVIQNNSIYTTDYLLGELAGYLYFRGMYNSSGGTSFLWKTDGTSSGTQLVTTGCEPNYTGTVFNNELYFIGYDVLYGKEIWKVNAAGNAQRITDFEEDLISGYLTGPGGIYGHSNNKIYFFAEDVDTGDGIFSTDGTLAGTIPVATLLANQGFSYITNVTIFDNTVYFVAAESPSTERKIYKANASGSGATEAAILPQNVYDPERLTVFNNKLYFRVAYAGQLSWEFYLYELSPNSTTPTLIYLDNFSTLNGLSSFTVSNNNLFFKGLYGGPDLDDSEPFILQAVHPLQWTGNTSTNWFTASNWEPQQVPVDTNDVLIPAGLTNYPVITAGTAKCKKFNINAGATLTMTGGNLNCYGEFKGDNSTCFSLTGGTVKLYGGGTFPSGIKFNNLTITSLNNEASANSYDLPLISTVSGNLVMSGTAQGNNPDYPKLLMHNYEFLFLDKNLTINQGIIGIPHNLLPTNNNSVLPVVLISGISTTQQQLRFSNSISSFDNYAGILADLEIENTNVKLIDMGKAIQVLNLKLYANFDLRGNYLTTGGKIIYLTQTALINNSNASNNGWLNILNDIRYSTDNGVAFLRCNKIGSTLGFGVSTPTSFQLANDTLVFLSNVAVKILMGGSVISMNGKNLTIGQAGFNNGLMQNCEIANFLPTGTLKFLGTSNTLPYEFTAKYLNNLTVDAPNGVKLMNIEYDGTDYCSVWGTVRLTNGSLDRNGVSMYLERYPYNNSPNIAKFIETAPNRCYDNLQSDIQIDTTYTTPLTNVNPGGLGFYITTPENWLNKISIQRLNGSGYGAMLIGNNIADCVYGIYNQNAGGNLNARIKIKYDENELNGIPESELRIYRYNSLNTNPFELIPSTVNITSNIVSTTANLFELNVGTNYTYYFLASPNSPPNRFAAPVTEAPASTVNTLQLKAYPNPFTNQFNIGFTAQVKEEAQLTVMDMSGRVFHTAAVQITEGENTLNVCCLDNAPSGVYFVNLKTSAGNNMVRLIKNN